MADTIPKTSIATTTLDPNSIVDYLKSQNKPTDLASRGTLFTSTFGNSTPYTGTAAQNTALLTKLKMGGNAPVTDPKAISGSSSVQNGQQTNTALGNAAGAVNPPAPGSNTTSTTTPPPPVTGSGSTPTGTIIPANQVKITSAAGVGPDGKTQQGYDSNGNLFAEQIGPNGEVTGYSLISKGIQGPNNPFNPPDPNAPLTVASFQAGQSPTTGTITLSNGTTQNLTLPQGKTYASSTINASGDTVVTFNDGSQQVINKDPNIADQQNQAQNAKNLVIQQANDNQSVADEQWETARADLLQKQTNAVASATAQYNASNPDGSGSDKTSYLSDIQLQYQKEIDALDASHANNKLLSQDQVNSSLASIDQNLSTNVTAYKQNVQTTAATNWDTYLKNVDPSTPLDFNDPTTQAALTTAQIGGVYPQLALATLTETYGKAKIAYDKTLSTEQRSDRSQALSDYKTAMSSLTTDKISPEVMSAIAQKAVDAGLAPDLATAESLVNQTNQSAFKDKITAEKTAEAQANATARLALAQENATRAEQKKSVSDVTTFLKDADPSYVSGLKDLVTKAQGGDANASIQLQHTIADISTGVGADPSTVALALQMGVGIKPATTTVASTPGIGNLWGLLPDSKTTVKTTGSSSPEPTPTPATNSYNGIILPN